MKTILNENGLIANQASGPNTLDIQANSVRADVIYQGDQNLSVLVVSLTEKVNSLFDKVLVLSNDLVAVKTELKQSATEFASYKELEKLEQKLEKELKGLEKAGKSQGKSAAKEVVKEEASAKQ
ncbi:hypothetical protein EBU95_07935 [bacterium]|nr:hypothetical protein [bacterium]